MLLVDEWKLIAVLTVFATGCIGCAASPVSALLQRKVASDESELASSTRQGLRKALLVAERVTMALGCGVMLGVAIIHIIPEAMDSLVTVGWLQDLDTPYPLAPAITTGSILLLYFFHMELHHRVDHTKQPVTRMHTLEAGLVVHSVLIGFALGASTTVEGLRSLTIAMMFHQLCEGFAMGAAIKEAAAGDGGISTLHQALMVTMFGLSTPIGVVIGWFSVTSDEQALSEASLGTQGVFSAVAAGILICAALCEFLPQLYGLGAHQHHHHEHEHLPDGVVVDLPSAVALVMSDAPAGGDNTAPSSNETPPTAGVPLWYCDCSNGWTRLVNHAGVLVGAFAMGILALWS